jgi:hypothetical protein
MVRFREGTPRRLEPAWPNPQKTLWEIIDKTQPMRAARRSDYAMLREKDPLGWPVGALQVTEGPVLAPSGVLVLFQGHSDGWFQRDRNY